MTRAAWQPVHNVVAGHGRRSAELLYIADQFLGAKNLLQFRSRNPQRQDRSISIHFRRDSRVERVRNPQLFRQRHHTRVVEEIAGHEHVSNHDLEALRLEKPNRFDSPLQRSR